jgi:NodT family efflux transporter outer membrane factor (OMF) lipoprotein
MRMRLTIGVSILALSLSGCANFEASPSMEVKIPQSFQQTSIATQDQQITGDWWQSANDPVLASLINEIETNNLSLEQARARLQAARSNARVGEFLPNITAGGDVQYNRLIKGASALNPIATGGAEKNTGYYNAKLDASWELPIYGQAQDALDSKRAGIEFAKADMEHIHLSMVAETIRLYSEMRRWQNTYAQRQKIEDAQKQILSYQNIKHGAGLIDDKEKFEAERTYLAATQDTRLAMAELYASQYQLASILGITEIPSAWNDVATIPDFKVDGIGQTPADVLRLRPDIKRAEASVAQQAAEFEISKSEIYPKFTLTGTLSQLANVLGNPLTGKTIQLAGVPAVSIPLFDWGQRISRTEQENAKLKETISAYRQTVIEAMNEVNEFMTAHEAAYNNKRAASQQADLQIKTARLVEIEFQKGTKSGIEKEQAIIIAAEADIAAQAALADRAARLAALTKALGVLSHSTSSPSGESHE